MEKTPLLVSEAIAIINQTLDYAYPVLVVEGEVASFKINQNKYVFFDLKDESGTLGCFMTVYQLRLPIQDGMRVRVVAQPKLTQWGKFSLTVREVQPVGEGSLKKVFEILKTKLEKEGLFAAERKRTLPKIPSRIGVVSSTQAAGYADFIKIINERWGGLDIVVAHVQVQGSGAAEQIIRAINHLNQLAEPVELIALIRGGGSADDLSVFNDEPLVRAIAASRAPVITGIGHEVDESLSDLVADMRAATPSNVAQVVVPNRDDFQRYIDREVQIIAEGLQRNTDDMKKYLHDGLSAAIDRMDRSTTRHQENFRRSLALLEQVDPSRILKKGYSIMRDKDGKVTSSPRNGDVVTIETKDSIIKAGVTHVSQK